ncbi:acyltransferase [Microtetraspora sp. NBRC 13810]|uniref:acyltransferase family protein n=1 Tax=Microtetraspora sp. NBRC 13810 TaxID=3030990 RepID=UPI0024A4831C|nr:acyltransferase [Microtetraspora sp. NBRC 13810]GLW05782.1 acyltransferase [Microtetraspora sp. NBRC 13810]
MRTPDIPTNESTVRVGGRIPALTGMRWWAALLVFFYHAAIGPLIFPEPQNLFGQFTLTLLDPGGGLGVSFFFVLSGFVLTWSARAGDTPVRIWRRRAVKIYPNHLAVCFLAIGVMLATGFTDQLHHVLPTLLLVQTWTPDFWAAVGVNGVSWSLACELLFYVCFPLWIWLITKIRPERLWYWACAVIAAVMLVPAVATLLPDTPKLLWAPMSAPEYWFAYKFPVPRMLEFVLGILLARIVMTGRWINLPLRAAWALMAVGYVVAMFSPPLFRLVGATIIPIALLIPALATRDLRGGRTLLGSRTMVWLGNISFAFYLFHRMVLEYTVRAFGEDFQWNLGWALAATLIALLVTTLLAAALFEFFEKPIYRRFSEPRRKVAEPVPQPESAR